MKKQYLVGAGCLAVGIVIGACFIPCNPRIATVNVNQIVRSYPKVDFIQRENSLKVAELSQWIDASQKKIDAEKDKTKKATLIRNTKATALQKKAEIQQEYIQKTAALDQEITDIVSKIARKKGFKTVFAKTSVVAGGVDITDSVLEEFKEEKK